MKTNKTTIMLACFIFIILATGCAEIKQVSKEESMISGGQTQIGCQDDSGCIIGGCSGTVCQPKSAEPIITTCEYKDEYACYRQIKCVCINNRCAWDKTGAFDICVEEAREKPAPVPIA